MRDPILAADATIPEPPHTDELWLEPLQPKHNDSDLAAWTSSIPHIQTTPGMVDWGWPPEGGYTVEENLADMEMHERHFAERTGFTYTVLDPTVRDVIGCVYIYGVKDGPAGQISIRSWVRADKAHLDAELYRLVSDWVAAEWPFTDVVYAPR